MVGHTIAENGIVISSDSYLKTFTFRKEEGRWIMEFHELNGEKLLNEMLVGKDDMLDMLAKKKTKIRISLDTVPFDHNRVLNLVEICNTPQGGGFYMMHTSGGLLIKKRLWLCDFLLLVLGDIPEKIYLRKETF